MADQITTNTTGDTKVSWGSAVLFTVFVFFFFNFYQLIHEKFFVKQQPDQFGRLVSDHGIDALWIGLGILIVAGLFVSYFFRKFVWKYITSLRVGIVLMVAVTAGAALGTLVFQNAPEVNYKAFYGDGMTFIFSTHDPMVMDYARRLINLHDGKIFIDSALGKGSKFTIILPRK